LRFRAATQILKANCDEMAGIDQDNLRIKSLASNADFSSPSADPVGLISKMPAHASVKEGYPSKKWLFLPTSARLA